MGWAMAAVVQKTPPVASAIALRPAKRMKCDMTSPLLTIRRGNGREGSKVPARKSAPGLTGGGLPVPKGRGGRAERIGQGIYGRVYAVILLHDFKGVRANR